MLPQQKALANVIITPLDQPHRFDYALQCKCGFQSHGFKNEDKSVLGGDETALAKDAACQHLIQRHGAKPSEVPDLVRVTPFTTVGGMTWDQLDLRLNQWFKKHPPTPLAQAPALPPQKAPAIAPAAPTKPNEVQTGGNKK